MEENIEDTTEIRVDTRRILEIAEMKKQNQTKI